MAWRLSARSKRELEGVHPHLVEGVEYCRKYSPVDFGVHDGIRDRAEQRVLVDLGVSWTMKSRHLVGKEDGFGHAVDLVPYINGKLRWEWEAIYELAATMAEWSESSGTPIRWGGVWDRRLANLRFHESLEREVLEYGVRRRAYGRRVRTDGPHFELPNIRVYR
jgi:peptidoglycan L-alanyl-D-glutamate endopeptidase CwlK